MITPIVKELERLFDNHEEVFRHPTGRNKASALEKVPSHSAFTRTLVNFPQNRAFGSPFRPGEKSSTKPKIK
jgi:hypothetical protein